jgi:prepilin-type N-terminal cleavage/methylation domain-containing protein
MIRREHGFTLIELLVASTLMIIILGATLTTFEQFVFNSNRNQEHNDSATAARNTLDLLARQLRNHVSAAPDQQLGVDKVSPYDIVFQTVDQPKPVGSANLRNVRRVRYCLDSSVPTNEKVYTQSQTWTTAATPAAPSSVTCPDPAWPTTRIMVDHVVNRVNGQDRPVWTPNDAQLSHVSAIQSVLYVDRDTVHPPGEQRLDTTIFFRNANQAPRAQFSFLVNANHSVALNATGSFDPEGERITYQWLEGTDTIGQGLAFTWDDVPLGDHMVTLVVTDGSGLSESVTQQVTVTP